MTVSSRWKLPCHLALALICASAVGLSGCGDGDGDEADGDGTGSDDGGPPLSHADDIQPIWDANCGGSMGECHVGGGQWEQPVLVGGNAYGAIVGKMALQPIVNSVVMNYIEPDDPGKSYLLHKLKGTHAEGGMGGGEGMPCDSVNDVDGSCSGTSGMLSAADIEKVENWINQGAPE